MADQTVSLTLTADAESLKSALRESGQLMDDLAGSSQNTQDTVEGSLAGLAAFWDEHSRTISNVGIAAGAAGAGLEGLIRRQQDNRAEAGRLAAILDGETTDSIMRLAAESHNATTDLDELVEMMMTGRQQGLDSGRDLQAYAEFWDMVGDATGETAGALAEASSALRTVGIDAGNEAQALDAFGFIAGETTTSVGEFLGILERVGPDLAAIGGDIDDAAALLGVLEQQFGLTGRQARREFEAAVRESDGTMQGLLDTLGISQETYEEFRGQVSASSDVIRDQAEAFAESRTPLQRMTASFESFLAANSGLVEGLGALTPLMIGAGGLVGAVGRLQPMVGPLATGFGRLAQNATGAETALRGIGRAAGLAAAALAVDAAIRAIGDALTDWYHGPVAAAQDMELALIGIANAGQIPDSVVGSLDGLGDAFDFLDFSLGGFEEAVRDTSASLYNMPVVGTMLFPMLQEDAVQLDRARETVAQFDRAMADLVRTGNPEAVQAGLEQLGEAVGLTGDELDQFARDNLPEYARALDAAEIASSDAADAVDDLGGAFDDAGGEALTAAEAVDEWIAAVRRATDPVFALMDAIDKVDDAQQAYNAAVAEFGVQSDEAQAAAIDLMRAVQDLEAAAIDGDLSFEDFEAQLNRWVDQGRITEEQAGLIRDRVREARDEADQFEGTRTLVVNATGNAWDRLAQLRSLWSDRSRTDMGSTRERARGGPVDPSMGPVLVGEEGPELVTFARSGWVHDAAATSRMMASPPPPSRTINQTLEFNVMPDDIQLFRARDEARALAEALA